MSNQPPPPKAAISTPRRSPNHGSRPAGRGVEMLVLHYTGMANAAVAIERLCAPSAAVSAHYVVDEDGTVLALVDETRVAWHAGVSCWRGRSGLNATSIGVEIVNGGHDFGLPAYADAQIDAVIALARGIIERWTIAPVDVVGHSDVAPMRKRDPGERFPWRRLARGGVGLWPEPLRARPPSGLNVARALERIGYGLDDAPQPTSVSAALRAFQQRFLAGHPCDGRADQPTRARLAQVAAAYAVAAARRST